MSVLFKSDSHVVRYIKDATSQKNYGPTPDQYRTINNLTFQFECGLVCDTLIKRLSNDGKYWRHIYKALLLLDYILKNGSMEAVERIKRRNIEIKTLHSFQKVKDSNGQDVGINVRERSKAITLLLMDAEELEAVRKEAKENKNKQFSEQYSSDYKTSMTETHEARKAVNLPSIVLKESKDSDTSSVELSPSYDDKSVSPIVSPRYGKQQTAFDVLENKNLSSESPHFKLPPPKTSPRQRLPSRGSQTKPNSTVVVSPSNEPKLVVNNQQPPLDIFTTFNSGNPTQQIPKNEKQSDPFDFKNSNQFDLDDPKKSWKKGIDVSGLTLDSLQTKPKQTQTHYTTQPKRTLGEL
ncbi:ENTH domain containing protein [Entamoeba marina]